MPMGRLPSHLPPFFSPRFAADPQPTLQWLREHSPIYAEPFSRMLVLTRHADCEAALRDTGLSAAGGQAVRQGSADTPVSMLNTDGAEHDRLRRPAGRLLGPPAIRRISGQIALDMQSVIDGLRGLSKEPDLLTDVAEPLSTLVLAHLFSITGVATRQRLDHHARAVRGALNPVPDPRSATDNTASMAAFATFLDEEVLPNAKPGSPLAELLAEPDLSTDEVKGVLGLCLVGGWSPWADVLTSTVRVALTNPDAAEQLRSEGSAADLVEEVLRWHTPIPFVARHARRAVTLPSGSIPKGAMVLIHIGSANRDSTAFSDPDEVVSGRVPRQHLALGAGAHFCMGAALIRATAPAAAHQLLSTYPDLAALDPGEPTFAPAIFPRTATSTRLRLGTARNSGTPEAARPADHGTSLREPLVPRVTEATS